MLYKIKTITIYEVEADSHEEAIEIYEGGHWDTCNDVMTETPFELGYTDDHDYYHVLRED